MSKSGWKSSGDLLRDIKEAHARLLSDNGDVERANAEARLFGAAAKVIGVQLDHAKLTNRLTVGNSTLPDMTLE